MLLGELNMNAKMVFLSNKNISKGLLDKTIKIDGNILYINNKKYKVIIAISKGFVITEIKIVTKKEE
jgi:hypothetical protein